jgi:hypothetical protein
LSSAVEKICDFLVGMVVLRSIRRVNTPPSVSMPRRQRGHVQQNHILHVALQHAGLDGGAHGDDLVGFTPLCGSLPKNLVTSSMTLGMRVMPPTRTTSSISDPSTGPHPSARPGKA